MSASSVTVGSLYSGIAGLELGVLAAFVEAGIPARIAWQCEIDPFCSRVLAHHFPDVQRFSDVATVSHPPPVHVLVGGFACQDVSAAGKGAGLGVETRSGFTLYHMLRIIDEILPPYLVIENVASGAKRWLPRVVQELRDRGYRPRAVPLGAVDVGAPHRRLRVFVVAHRERSGLEVERIEQARRQQPAAERSCGAGGTETLAHGRGRERERLSGILDGEREALGDDADGRGGGKGEECWFACGCGWEEIRCLDERCSACGRIQSGSVNAVADSGPWRRGPGRWVAEHEWQSDTGLGGALPNTKRVQLRDEQGRRGGAYRACQGEPGDDGEVVVDAAKSGRERPDRSERQGPPLEPERSGDRAAGDGRPAQPGVGAGPDGLPFDVAGHTFPAGRGEAPHPWEPPRTLPGSVKVPDRPAKLRACGNAVVPQQGLVVGRVLVEMGAPW